MDFFSRKRLRRAAPAAAALALAAGCATGGAARPAAAPSGAAQSLVASMHESAAALRGPRGELAVSVAGIRNHSHASAAEFDEARARLAAALGGAATELGLPMTFAIDPGGTHDLDLAGTAYLVTASGFDQWEIYAELRRAGESWSVWAPPGAIRMLRQPRAGEPALFVAPQAR
jgi:hypothetical protein